MLKKIEKSVYKYNTIFHEMNICNFLHLIFPFSDDPIKPFNKMKTPELNSLSTQ